MHNKYLLMWHQLKLLLKEASSKSNHFWIYDSSTPSIVQIWAVLRLTTAGLYISYFYGAFTIHYMNQSVL